MDSERYLCDLCHLQTPEERAEERAKVHQCAMDALHETREEQIKVDAWLEHACWKDDPFYPVYQSLRANVLHLLYPAYQSQWSCTNVLALRGCVCGVQVSSYYNDWGALTFSFPLLLPPLVLSTLRRDTDCTQRHPWYIPWYMSEDARQHRQTQKLRRSWTYFHWTFEQELRRQRHGGEDVFGNAERTIHDLERLYDQQTRMEALDDATFDTVYGRYETMVQGGRCLRSLLHLHWALTSLSQAALHQRAVYAKQDDETGDTYFTWGSTSFCAYFLQRSTCTIALALYLVSRALQIWRSWDATPLELLDSHFPLFPERAPPNISLAVWRC